jgi:hypothetical protein
VASQRTCEVPSAMAAMAIRPACRCLQSWLANIAGICWNADGRTVSPPHAQAMRSSACSYSCGYVSSVGSSDGWASAPQLSIWENIRSERLTSASSQSGVESSSSSPIPSKHPLITTGIHPSTRFTIDGLLSLKLTINSRAAFRTSSPSSSLGSSFAFPGFSGGKSNVNEPSVG